jgi:hypothetical protein
MKDNNITLQKILILLVITVLTVFLLPACNSGVKNEKEVETNPNTINVLWQNVSSWGDSTIELVSKVNPDKFIINVDGPGSNDTNKHTGPHAKDLIIFIDSLSKHWTGTLAMHTDCSLGDFKRDWNIGGKYDTIPWASYVDYFLLLNDSLKYHCLPHFTELLIETENSMMSAKAINQKPLFDKIRTRINDSSIMLSATSDWHAKWTTWGVDCYYAQMYDMCYPLETGGMPSLCGANHGRMGRADTIVPYFVEAITNVNNSEMINQDGVYFIFSFAPNKKCPNKNAPQFGETSLVWDEKDFMYFLSSFETTLKPHTTSTINVGAWDTRTLLRNW